MAIEPLHLDFYGRLAVVVETASAAYLPARRVLARTFSAFVRRSENAAPAAPARLSLRLGPFEPDLRKLVVVDDFYHVGEDRIFASFAHKPARWKADIRGLHAARTEARIAGNVFSHLVFPFETAYQLILFKLGMSGLAFLHALGVEKEGRACLIIGRSGVGKSTLGGKFLRDGYRLLGDDTVFVDAEGRVYGFPVPIGLRSLSREEYGIRMGFRDRALFLAFRALKWATLGRIGLLFKLDASRLGRRLAAEARLERALFALPAPVGAPGKPEAPEPAADRDLFADQAVRCSGFELALLSKLLEAHAYVRPGVPGEGFHDRQAGVLRAAFSKGSLYRVGLPGTLTEPVYHGLRTAMEHG